MLFLICEHFVDLCEILVVDDVGQLQTYKLEKVYTLSERSCTMYIVHICTFHSLKKGSDQLIEN